MSKLKIALQKSGRLSEDSIELLRECGIDIDKSSRKLKTSASKFPLEVLFLRDDDIPKYVEEGIADIGIVGQNEVWEKGAQVNEVMALGFAACRISLAIPREVGYTDLNFFEGKRVATSYPNILRNFFEEKGIQTTIEELSGSVEIAPSIGLADGIFDIVSSGSTLLTNGLREVEVVCKSEAVLIGKPNPEAAIQRLIEALRFRIEAVQSAKGQKYILLNAPNEAIQEIVKILPGMKSPTVMPLYESGWSSLHTVIPESAFWSIIDQLKSKGAQGILVSSIEKMIY